MSSSDDICVIPAPGENSGIINNLLETTVSHYNDSNVLSLNNTLVNVVPNTFRTTTFIYVGLSVITAPSSAPLVIQDFGVQPVGIYNIGASVNWAAPVGSAVTDEVVIEVYSSGGHIQMFSFSTFVDGAQYYNSGVVTVKTTAAQNIYLRAYYTGGTGTGTLFVNPNITLQKIG